MQYLNFYLLFHILVGNVYPRYWIILWLFQWGISFKIPLLVFAPKALVSKYHKFCFVCRFMLRKGYLQAELITLRWFWRPLGVLDMRALSSSKRTISSTNPGSSWIPCMPCCSIYDAILLIYKKENIYCKIYSWQLSLSDSQAVKSLGQSIYMFYSKAQYHIFI